MRKASTSPTSPAAKPADDGQAPGRSETIVWHVWNEQSGPPVDRPFLAWMIHEEDGPWCCTLNAADDEGHYFILTGSCEYPDVEHATHWAEMPKGPS